MKFDFSNTHSLSIAILCCIFAQVGFGFARGYAVVLQYYSDVKDSFNVVVYSCLRDVFAALVLLAIAFVTEKGNLFLTLGKLSRVDILFHMVFGFTGIFGNQLFVVLGLYYTSAAVSSMWQPSIPVWAYLIECILGTQTNGRKASGYLSKIKVVGVLCTAIGVVCLHYFTVANKDKNAMRNPLLGSFCLFLNTSFTAIYMVLQKRFIFQRFSNPLAQKPIVTTFLAYCFGAVFMVLTLIFGETTNSSVLGLDNDNPRISFTIIVPLLYGVFITSVFCYILLATANRILSSAVVTAFWPLQVPVCLILSYTLLETVVETQQVIGGICVILGLLMLSYAEYYQGKIPSEQYTSLHDRDSLENT